MSATPPPPNVPASSDPAGQHASSDSSSTSSKSSDSSYLSPNTRSARFIEATSVHSPIDAPLSNPFADPAAVGVAFSSTQPAMTASAAPGAAGQPGDIGFGYIQDNEPPIATQTVGAKSFNNGPLSPLKSALKTPGAPGRNMCGNPLSPTFKEDVMLEKAEAMTDKEQEKDLRVKTRVRLAKIILRGVNFSCSLVVLSLIVATFQIFNATKAIAPRNGLRPWAKNTPTWPQITLLCIACISLTFAVFILYSNIRHGHRRAEKVAVYYTTFAVAFFIFNIVMWGVGAAILSGTLNSSDGSDMWGWACKDNRRRQLFENDINYGLVCRLQNWALLCAIIEVVIELFVIAIYGFIFYRFWSKRRLRKSMAVRDRARSDLYLAKLRSQSAPNTPGLNGPRTPYGGAPNSPGYIGTTPVSPNYNSGAYAVTSVSEEKPFSLQPAPRMKKGTTDSSPVSAGSSPSVPYASSDVNVRFFNSAPAYTEPDRNVSMAAAPGEQSYGSVVIPGQYNHMTSSQQQNGNNAGR